MSFLKAEWRKLAIANYEIDPALLRAYLPFGTELDLWQGKCYVSLIGFMFVKTRVLGIANTFHTEFEEVNLRFYVKRHENGIWKRGVVFIREIVPKAAITFVANTLYKENYQTLSMSHCWEETETERRVAYRWKKNQEWSCFSVVAEKEAQPILPESESEFITEHYWGYVKVNDAKSNEYEVTHPRWLAYNVKEYAIQTDFAQTYGKEFDYLNRQQPVSVMLAEGSSITVEPKRIIGK